nr:hypothetical protein [Tanacetum cinerariifolium]
KASKAKSLYALSEVAITEAQQLKLVTKRSLQQTYISQASGSGADEGTENLVLNVGREEGHDEEEEKDELYWDVNINQGMGIQTTQEFEDSHVTLTPRMNKAVKVAVQIEYDHLCNEAQKENDVFLKTIDENMQKIIKQQVKEQVKVKVSKILPMIEQNVNEQLEVEVPTRSLNLSKTSYAIAVDLSEMELKKILIEKMEGNMSIQQSNEQRNLYKALIEVYESDKIILDTYGDTVTLKRRHDDDADRDEEPSARPDRGSTQASKSQQMSISKSATIEEPMQTTFEMEEPTHPEFEIGADDQPIVESSQHLEWFSQQQKPSTSDHDWNKTLPATHESIQP